MNEAMIELTWDAYGSMQGDTPDGLWTWRFAGGGVAKHGEFRSGKPIGIWTWYNKDGSVHTQLQFNNGALIQESFHFSTEK
jgi:antitoxin component YwqK of YwqJK toxin-antitoxin module